MKKKWLWADLLWQGLLGLLAFWVIYRFADGTTPMRPNEYHWDSALFQAVGKLWADGLTPYREVFDHKGPLLFLIQKIAYHFPQPRMALYVIESLFVSTSLWLGYHILRLKMKPVFAFLGTLLMLAFWLPLMEYGNLCETYSMPFLMLPLFLQLRYFKDGQAKHPPLYALIYGLCFGANMMLRPNNGLFTAIITLMITIELLCRRQWKNILCNACMLIMGVLAAVLPFIAYFSYRKAMVDFIYATWTFNLIYAESLELSLQSLRSVLAFITPSLVCMFLSVCALIRRRFTAAAALLLSGVGTILITISGIGYAHYFMLHVPLIALALYFGCELAGSKRSWQVLMALTCAAFTLFTLRTTLPIAKAEYLTAPTAEEIAHEQAYNDMVEAIAQAIPADEHDEMVAAGLAAVDVEMFLNTDFRPVSPYCFLLEWHSRADNAIRNDYLETLQHYTKWVILRVDQVGEQVMHTLDTRFDLHSTYEYDGIEYRLYRRK